MKAAEYRNKESITDANFYIGNEINFDSIYEFTEDYHKAKVEAISKEEIYSKICQFVRDMGSLTRQPLITHRKVSHRSVNWFKEQLLK